MRTFLFILFLAIPLFSPAKSYELLQKINKGKIHFVNNEISEGRKVLFEALDEAKALNERDLGKKAYVFLIHSYEGKERSLMDRQLKIDYAFIFPKPSKSDTEDSGVDSLRSILSQEKEMIEKQLAFQEKVLALEEQNQKTKLVYLWGIGAVALAALMFTLLLLNLEKSKTKALTSEELKALKERRKEE